MTFVISMVPVVELRGAIPFGLAAGLGYFTSFAAAVLGNIFPVPFIILFCRRIFAWMRRKSRRLDSLVNSLVARANKKASLVHKYELLGLAILVAIPLPGTGAWTGSLIAVVLGLRLKHALPAIAIGVIIAGVAVSLLSYYAVSAFGIAVS